MEGGKTKEQLIDELKDLRLNEERMKLAMDGAKYAYWDLDIASGRLQYNAHWYEMLGFKSAEVKHISTWQKLIHPDDYDRVIKALNGHLEGCLPSYDAEYRIRSKSGEWIWVHGRGKVTENQGNGKPRRMLGVTADITERKKAAESQKKSNELLNSISKIQSQFIQDVNTHGLFNKMLDDILSLTQSEYGFIGEVLFTTEGNPYLKTHAITNIAWNEETQKLYEETVLKGMEFHNLKTLFGAVMTSEKPVISNNPTSDPRRGGLPEGHPPLNAFLGLPFHSNNKIIGMIGISNRPDGYDEELAEFLKPLLSTCSNMIEAYRIDNRRKKSEKALLLKSAELTLMNKELHELAMAITRIEEKERQKLSEVLHEGIGQNLVAIKMAFEMGKNTPAIHSLIEETIHSTRSLTEKLYQVNYDELNLTNAIKKDIKTFLEPKGIAVSLKIDKTMACSKDVTKKYILKIIRECLQNILKHASASRVVVEIKKDKGHYQIKVKDNGIGFAGRGNKVKSGEGIGLMLMREWAKSLNGHLNIKSQPGKGTEIKVELPDRKSREQREIKQDKNYEDHLPLNI